MSKYTISVDGASSGKAGPQPAAAAIVVYKSGKKETERGLYLSCTNNQSELTAIYLAVQYFVEVSKAGDTLEILSDSQWAVRCLAQKLDLDYIPEKYNTVHFPEIFSDILRLWRKDSMRLTWIIRENNTEADALAKATKHRGY